MARPRANDWLLDEIESWRCEGVNVVISLLEAAETAELGLDDEQALCLEAGMTFTSFPIPDRGVPANRTAALGLADALVASLGSDEAVAVHCRAGIGRSSLIAALALVRMGMDPDVALALIGEARGLSVPDTDEQRTWLRDCASR